MAALIARGARGHSGIGGASVRVVVGGVSTFIKLIPLTDLERALASTGSTENVFRLPPQYHYGIGSAGFTARRELSAHRRLSDMMSGGEDAAVPLLYHWRALDQPPAASDR